MQIDKIKKFYDLEIVDIRDARAKSILNLGLDNVGLIGDQSRMESDFSKSKLPCYKKLLENTFIRKLFLN